MPFAWSNPKKTPGFVEKQYLISNVDYFEDDNINVDE